MFRTVMWILLIIFIAMQFIRPSRNISSAISSTDIIQRGGVPENVVQNLKVACYDCHSNNTRYPWYSNLQPVGWWLQNHVNDGKREINFSEFYTYPPAKQVHKLKEVAEQVRESEMPLDSYLWIHHDAKLTEAERNAMAAWADALGKQIKVANNVPDEKPRPQD